MTIHETTTYWVECDRCGTDGGDSRPTYEEAADWAEGWAVGADQHLCDDCRVAAEAAANEQIILEEE